MKSQHRSYLVLFIMWSVPLILIAQSELLHTMVSILEAPHNAQAQRHLTALRLRLSSKAAHAGGVVHLRA